MSRKRVVTTIPLIVLAGLTLLLHQSTMAEPEAPATSPDWQTTKQISIGANSGGLRPRIAVAPNGRKVVIAYARILSGPDNKDIYFSRSTDNGENWTSPARIHNSQGTASDSVAVDVAFGANNKAHAVWVEAGSSIVYKYEDNWGNNSDLLRTISAPTLPIALEDPKIVVRGNNRLDVVWSEGTVSTDVNIYHAYSTSAVGNGWQGKATVANSLPTSRLPDITLDSSGVYHVVWEEQTTPTAVIMYVRGTLSGDNMIWSAPVNISQVSSPTGDALQPQITSRGSTVHVSFTEYRGGTNQFVHHVQCSSNCTDFNNWKSTNNPISGTRLGAKATDPFDVVSTIATLGPCTWVFFHGIHDANGNNNWDDDNERIWGTGNCNNWVSTRRSSEAATGPAVRAINPSMAAHNNWWLYIAYEQVTTDRQIYFVRNDPKIYLPFVMK